MVFSVFVCGKEDPGGGLNHFNKQNNFSQQGL